MATIQRGSGWSIKLVFTLYKIFGYKFTYFLMFPVTFFYFIFASNVKKALRIYYNKLDIKLTNRRYFNHLFMFAMCMVDRFISKADCNSYNFSYENRDFIKQRVDNGSILLLSHFGGWSVTNCKTLSNNIINVVMKEVILESIKKIENSIKRPLENIRVIDQSQNPIEVSIKIANAISNKECIAFMADRAVDNRFEEKIEFLGELASFNTNPFKVAYKTKTPLTLVFVINNGLQSYHIKSKKIDMNFDLDEKTAITLSLKEYVKSFEDIVKQYPSQWFNLYNFWEKAID
ncbi:lipid A biosynthesis acyltransferase [Aliarcobacter trophiarum LMG 25534]|uniref:Lipid A biosynthesis acyltransferase n=1 Tax=Aliarcobacter trophiarum LMG 25534 TaxID=1032241 RepID=A0AAD0VM96_9BACT|nr:lysophospholipid acyltransferase family protein [Aliarcobacter trophiarum]AXK49067.1 lysophospholipid acyltransferase [Aliarcobacter trophiarum LMG 25534]RXI28239.1 lipid A biosynthesis acyltransferase [Aliarcobacter trophiarum]RXJ90956.1 lipid A biosynthesis acyltransferase [Aliarcobacter trophiarum LMG 25534]